MFGAETLDHVAFPVRDLLRAEKFYIETVGLAFLTQRSAALCCSSTLAGKLPGDCGAHQKIRCRMR